MARDKLTAVAIRKAGVGKLFDGAGLYLIKTQSGGSWVYRFTHLGKRRDMGLGPYPALSLADARAARNQWAAVLADGRDPVSTRAAQQAAEKAERDASNPTLSEAIDMTLESRRATLRQPARWVSPLDIHIKPVIGRKRLSEVDQADIKDAIAPIWKTKHPTAEKCVDRLRIVFIECKLMGYGCDPFTVSAAERMLGAYHHEAQPIPSTPWQDIPDLYGRLGDSSVDMALKWLILSAVRCMAGLGARQIEIADGVWTVPKERVKATKKHMREFRVPVTGPMQEIADTQAQYFEDLLFESHITGKPVTDAAIEKRLRTIGEEGRPHGFRSSFRTWAEDSNAVDWTVAETILGHSIGTKVERSYQRSDLLDRRRVAMEKWAAHVTGANSDVVKLRG